jgi:hypothetical protein
VKHFFKFPAFELSRVFLPLLLLVFFSGAVKEVEGNFMLA